MPQGRGEINTSFMVKGGDLGDDVETVFNHLSFQVEIL